jgi:hypothetical protein
VLILGQSAKGQVDLGGLTIDPCRTSRSQNPLLGPLLDLRVGRNSSLKF